MAITRISIVSLVATLSLVIGCGGEAGDEPLNDTQLSESKSTSEKLENIAPNRILIGYGSPKPVLGAAVDIGEGSTVSVRAGGTRCMEGPDFWTSIGIGAAHGLTRSSDFEEFGYVDAPAVRLYRTTLSGTDRSRFVSAYYEEVKPAMLDLSKAQRISEASECGNGFVSHIDEYLFAAVGLQYIFASAEDATQLDAQYPDALGAQALADDSRLASISSFLSERGASISLLVLAPQGARERIVDALDSSTCGIMDLPACREALENIMTLAVLDAGGTSRPEGRYFGVQAIRYDDLEAERGAWRR